MRSPLVLFVPSELRKLKGLRSLTLVGLDPCILSKGCLDLPHLQSLEFRECHIQVECHIADAEMLRDLTALQSLTRIESWGGQGPPFTGALVQLPRLQRMVFETIEPCDNAGYTHCGACPGLAELPADMGPLSPALLHLNFSGHGFAQFPLALTQLAALKCLRARANEFAELLAAITALSRLTELSLGRIVSDEDPLQLHEKRPLDARALGDLSGFPALCELGFDCCEVMFCDSMLGAVWHASLASLCFSLAHPAPRARQR